MIKKQRFLLFLLISVLTACTNRNDNRINVGVLKGPTAISMAYMIEKADGFDLPDVQYHIYPEPLLLRSAILRDEVDIATIPSVMACNLINNGKDLKIAAIPIWGTLHLFGTNENISSWNDLQGKEVFMMAEGLTPDLIFRALLKANGMIPGKDVRLNYSFQTHQDLANASIAGRAPLAVLSEPLVSRAIEHSEKLARIFDLNAEWNKRYGDSILLAQTALVANLNGANLSTEKLNLFLKKYEACCQLVNENSNFPSEFMVKHKILNNKALAEDAIVGCNINFVKAEEISKGLLNYFDFIYNMEPRLTGAPGNIKMIYQSAPQTN